MTTETIRRKVDRAALALILAVGSLGLNIANADDYPHLPPLQDWTGKSEQLLAREKSTLTPAERTDLSASPSFGDTIAHIHKIAAGSPYVRLKSIGSSTQQHPIFMVVANSDGEREASAIVANNKPTVLVQAGIHAGEIDGKDAGLMLLRDIVSGKELALIQKVNILFIPILSADGHNRVSEYNRVNQRGPEYMGWRTNSTNLNLNRDYTKAETPAIQAVLNVINEYQPDLYLDIHVTDGEDYQYDITYGFNQPFASHSPTIANWLVNKFRPYVDGQLSEFGHTPGPLIFAWNKNDFKQGIAGWTASPRFSNGYGDWRHLPTILVENHSLKPYRRRVLGTYVFIKAAIELLANEHQTLQTAVKKDQSQRPTSINLGWKYAKIPQHMSFKGIGYQRYESAITGQTEIKWTGEPVTYDKLPVYWKNVPSHVVDVPKHYIVPVQYQQVINSLKTHGIKLQQVTQQQYRKEGNYQQFAIDSYKVANEPYEGRNRVEGEFSVETVKMRLPVGSVVVSTDQPLGRLVVALLDPRGEDSYFSWGYFNSIFQRTEYIENYAVIPLVEKMLAQSPKLKADFEKKLKEDQAFADDPRARLDFFYKRTPYYDQAYLKYPVLFEQD